MPYKLCAWPVWRHRSRNIRPPAAQSRLRELRPLCDGCRVRPFHEKSHITDCCHPDEKSSTLTSSITDGPMPKAVPSTSRTVRYQEPGPSGKAPHIAERIVSVSAIAQGLPSMIHLPLRKKKSGQSVISSLKLRIFTIDICDGLYSISM